MCGLKFTPTAIRRTVCSLHVTQEQIDAVRALKRGGIATEARTRAEQQHRDAQIVALYREGNISTHRLGVLFNRTATQIRVTLRKHLDADTRARIAEQNEARPSWSRSNPNKEIAYVRRPQ